MNKKPCFTKSKSFNIAFCGIIAALGVISNLLTGLIPIGTYALPAISGAILSIIVIEQSQKQAFSVYIITSLLSAILAVDKEAVAYYIFFFGYYPIIKSYLERIKNKILQFVLKLSVFNISMVCTYFVSIKILSIPEDSFEIFGVNLPIVFLIIGNFVFLLYDKAISGFLVLYIYKWRNIIFKNLK